MKLKRFFVSDQACGIVGGPFELLSDAVLAAASYDGWGACYQRDDDGDMRLSAAIATSGTTPTSPVKGMPSPPGLRYPTTTRPSRKSQKRCWTKKSFIPAGRWT